MPQCSQWTRRISSSREIRVSPHGRSRTRRVLRSYPPRWLVPQAPQALFPPPLAAHNTGFGVTEEAVYGWRGLEAGNTRGVPEVTVGVQPAIMPDFWNP
jgi:hypothetical protein